MIAKQQLCDFIERLNAIDCAAKKKAARTFFKQIRDGISAESRDTQSEAICRAIVASPEFANAKHIFVYRAIGSEVALDTLCETALKLGKVLAYPKCVRNEAGEPALDWYAVANTNDKGCFTKGAYGILEPDEKRLVKLVLQELNPKKSMVVVPGLAFDQRGMRLGYGGGYYDRFLSRFNASAIGASYTETYLDELSAADLIESHDIPLNAVATPLFA
jgi:5-formyltetrahydrofolate cyclo-ligase